MSSLTAAITEEITRYAKGAFNEIRLSTLEDNKTLLERRLRQNYDKLSLEQIQTIGQALGHTETEANPCKTCRIIAQKEFELAED